MSPVPPYVLSTNSYFTLPVNLPLSLDDVLLCPLVITEMGYSDVSLYIYLGINYLLGIILLNTPNCLCMACMILRRRINFNVPFQLLIVIATGIHQGHNDWAHVMIHINVYIFKVDIVFTHT